MQSLPLRAKVLMTQQRIRDWYEYWNGNVFLSFSGGKDSSVLKYIVDHMYSDVPSVFCNTGLEYPEIRAFAQAQPNVTTVYPKKRFVDVLKDYGYPIISKEISQHLYYGKSEHPGQVHYDYIHGLRMYKGKKSRYNADRWEFLLDAPFNVSPLCCDYTKKEPLKRYEKETGRHPYIATMACESDRRETEWLKTGCNAFESKQPTSKPLSFWTEQDILHYIKENNVPYCKEVYGDIVVKPKPDDLPGQINVVDYLNQYSPEDILTTTGANRTGCIFCGFGCHLDKHPNRFERLKETHPKQYAYVIGGGEYGADGKWVPNKDGLGFGKVLDYIGVKY